MEEIKVTVTPHKSKSITVSSQQSQLDISASGDTGRFWAQTAKNWAVSENIVDNEDYSSKYYANISKTNANSAKNYSETSKNVLTEVQNSGNVAIENINTDKELALSEIEAIKIDAVNTANEASSTINTNKTAAINEINTTKTSAVSSVNSTKNTAISEINTTKTNAVNAVNTSKKEALDAIAGSGVNNLANKDLSNLSTAGQEKFDEKVNVDDMVEVEFANAGSYIAGCAMPSNKYIDLTLGASGEAYTAPANGYVVLRKLSTAAGQNLMLQNITAGNIQTITYSHANGNLQGIYIPVKKGDQFSPAFASTSTTNQIFRFIYAEGEVE